jgi:uncharacterized alkaline shock family protein YloU
MMLSNAKGRLSKSKADGDGGFFECAWTEEGLNLRIFVIIKIGTSISAVTEELIKNIGPRMEELLEIRVGSITVAVKGMLTDKRVSSRDIEVKRP